MRRFDFRAPEFLALLNGGGGGLFAASDMLGYWKMDEGSANDDAADSSGNGNTLSPSSPSTPVTGLIVGARDLGSGLMFT